MRNHDLIKQCKDISGTNHRGPFVKLNKGFYQCETCKSIIGIELVKK
jgi:hypothetical protein